MYEREAVTDDEFIDYESDEFKSYADYVGDPDNEYDLIVERELLGY